MKNNVPKYTEKIYNDEEMMRRINTSFYIMLYKLLKLEINSILNIKK